MTKHGYKKAVLAALKARGPSTLTFGIHHPSNTLMERKALKNKSEQLRRGKKTLVRQAHKLATVHNIDIAIIMHKNGQYCTYRSLDHESWPPTMKQIVSRKSCGRPIQG